MSGSFTTSRHLRFLYRVSDEVLLTIWVLVLVYTLPSELPGTYNYLLVQNFNYGATKLLEHLQNSSVKHPSYS